MRLFFALWPDPHLRRALARWVRLTHARCGGRPSRSDTLHLTLAFLGDVPRERLPALSAAAGRVFAPYLDFPVDQVGAWAHNHLVWAGCQQVDAGLAGLAGALQEQLRSEGFTLPARDFVPHVTLLRRADVTHALPVVTPLRWQAADFVLLRTLPQGGYEVVHRWPLGFPAAGGEGSSPQEA